jgi:hypothetical protein
MERIWPMLIARSASTRGKSSRASGPPIPVQQVVKIEMVVNLKTAKTLGITFPLPLIGRADEVIE